MNIFNNSSKQVPSNFYSTAKEIIKTNLPTQKLTESIFYIQYKSPSQITQSIKKEDHSLEIKDITAFLSENLPGFKNEEATLLDKPTIELPSRNSACSLFENLNITIKIKKLIELGAPDEALKASTCLPPSPQKQIYLAEIFETFVENACIPQCLEMLPTLSEFTFREEQIKKIETYAKNHDTTETVKYIKQILISIDDDSSDKL